jgi:hypothetical protein
VHLAIFGSLIAQLFPSPPFSPLLLLLLLLMLLVENSQKSVPCYIFCISVLHGTVRNFA